MPGTRQQGPDHRHFGYSAIVDRAPWRLPKGERLAVCPIIDLSYVEDYPPVDGDSSNWLAGGVGFRNAPNIARLSAREYGHRIGIFRLFDAFDRAGMRPAVAIDAFTARSYPWLLDYCRKRAEILAHGESVSRMISNRMAEDEERRTIQAAIDAIGSPSGWLGPEYGESERTPALLVEAGIGYVCDWCNDEQPYAMTNGLVAMPLMADLDDGFAIGYRGIGVQAYGTMLSRAFRQLYADGERTARLLAWCIRPFIMGQPSRIGALETALATMTGDIWRATPGEVAAHFRQSPWQAGSTAPFALEGAR